MSGTIKQKDAKILWSRAAGRCSMPDCRRKLTIDSKDASKSFTLGVMCHIVGEKNSANSARSDSVLPEEDRNNYSNLILLCSHHHDEIDKNEADWPVEILHKIKSDHEWWVEETLSSISESEDIAKPEDIAYTTIIDNINVSLKLEKWDWFVTNAVRSIVHRDFLSTLEYINRRNLEIIWPGKNLDLEKSIKDMMTSFATYMEHLLMYADINDGDSFIKEDVSYKRTWPNPDYHFIAERNNLWARKNFCLLLIYTCCVNSFASMVRKYYNPLFYLTKGNFLIIDEFGTFNGGAAVTILPDLKEAELMLDQVEKEIEKYESDPKNKFY